VLGDTGFMPYIARKDLAVVQRAMSRRKIPSMKCLQIPPPEKVINLNFLLQIVKEVQKTLIKSIRVGQGV
jgi:hypothetical protein